MILGTSKRRIAFMQMLIALIGVCAAAMLLWYVYILMKGDDQA
jgi:hypothetical protein